MTEKSLTKTQAWTNVPAPTYTAEYTANAQPGSVVDYWHMICRRKLLLTGLAITGLLIAVGVTLPQAPVYRARTTLEIQELNDNFVNMKLASPVAESPAEDALTNLQTQIKVLQSDTLIDRALQKSQISSPAALSLDQVDSASVRRILNLPAPTANRDKLIEMAAKNLKVSAASQTRIVEVAFDAPDPKIAARFANALTSEFIEQNMQARWQMSRQTSEWLAGQLDDLRDKLQRSEDALQAYARQKGLIYTGDKENVSDEKLRQLQAELSRAQADRVEKQSRSEIARTTAPETVPDVLNDGNLRTLETNLTDLRRQEAELGVTFKSDYGSAKKIHAEIKALESAIEEKRAAIVSRINNELQEAQRREQLLASAYARQARLVTDDSEKSIQYDVLKREVDTNRQIYEAMLQRVKESAIASAMKASNVRVIDFAKPPLDPYKPKLPINGGIGLVCGAVFGLIAIVIRARTDGSVHEPGDAALLLGIPELGVIPAAGAAQKTRSSVLTLFPREKEADSPGLRLILPRSQSLPVADSFRAVLASIIFAGAKERQRVLVLTSAGPGEGKTTTAANLAVTLANMHRKVLLIDGDIRSPRMHDIFGLDNSAGLSNLLKESVVDDNQLDDAARQTAFRNLYVLTSGPAVKAGADLLFSRSMASLIARYKERFDMVLIDTPPMLSMPDARVLGRMSDAVVLIARAGQTARAAIQAAFRRLVEDHTPVLGVVLNDWKAKSSAYKHYAAYKYPARETCIDTTAAKPIAD